MHVLHTLYVSWHLSTLSGESWTWSWISGLNHNWNLLIIINDLQLWSFENYTSKFKFHLKHKILCSFTLPSSSPSLSFYPWLPMVVSFFLTHLLLEVASPIIFLPSPFRCHDLQEANDSIDEEDPRPTSSTGSYIIYL